MTTNIMSVVREPHSFQRGNEVYVYSRNKPDIIYKGKIYDILCQPFQRGVQNSPLIDYFYISFSPRIIERFLLRGMSIIHRGKQKVINRIEKKENNTEIYLEKELFGLEDKCISVMEVEAVLVWRVAYIITDKLPLISKL